MTNINFGVLFLFVVSTLCGCQLTNQDYTFNNALIVPEFTPVSPTFRDDKNVTLEKNGAQLTLKSLRPGQDEIAARLINLNLTNLFQPSLAPYPGVVSDKVTCPASFKPVPQSIKNSIASFSGYKLYANGRWALGACSKENAKNIAYQGILKCLQTSSAFEILFFESNTDNLTPTRFEKFLAGIKCI